MEAALRGGFFFVLDSVRSMYYNMVMTIEEKREKVRLRNIKWRRDSREKYLHAAAKYRHSHPEKLTEYRLKSRYNITPEQYTDLFVSQGGVCVICGQSESAKHNKTKEVQKLAVDHCHKTGKIRGLLCQDCNRGLGKFQDDPARLENAAAYIRKYLECGLTT